MVNDSSSGNLYALVESVLLCGAGVELLVISETECLL